jgi:hypothetical protein
MERDDRAGSEALTPFAGAVGPVHSACRIAATFIVERSS